MQSFGQGTAVETGTPWRPCINLDPLEQEFVQTSPRHISTQWPPLGPSPQAGSPNSRLRLPYGLHVTPGWGRTQTRRDRVAAWQTSDRIAAHTGQVVYWKEQIKVRSCTLQTMTGAYSGAVLESCRWRTATDRRNPCTGGTASRPGSSVTSCGSIIDSHAASGMSRTSKPSAPSLCPTVPSARSVASSVPRLLGTCAVRRVGLAMSGAGMRPSSRSAGNAASSEAADQDGDVLDIPVTRHRDTSAAMRFFRKLLEGRGG